MGGRAFDNGLSQWKILPRIRPNPHPSSKGTLRKRESFPYRKSTSPVPGALPIRSWQGKLSSPSKRLCFAILVHSACLNNWRCDVIVLHFCEFVQAYRVTLYRLCCLTCSTPMTDTCRRQNTTMNEHFQSSLSLGLQQTRHACTHLTSPGYSLLD